MKITYLGHSCFLVEGSSSVLIDPFTDIGYPLKRVKADYVLCTHDHFDHNAYHLVDYGKKITYDSEDTIKQIDLVKISSYHDEVGGTKRGKNVIYKFTIDGITFTHLGDLGEDFNMDLVEKIGKTDVLFIPIGGVYTIDYKEATKYAKAINPKMIVPMHFKTLRSTVQVADNKYFLQNFDNVIKLQTTTLNFDKIEGGVYLFDHSNF